MLPLRPSARTLVARSPHRGLGGTSPMPTWRHPALMELTPFCFTHLGGDGGDLDGALLVLGLQPPEQLGMPLLGHLARVRQLHHLVGGGRKGESATSPVPEGDGRCVKGLSGWRDSRAFAMGLAAGAGAVVWRMLDNGGRTSTLLESPMLMFPA
jgi:hypothetical protein